MLILKKPEVGDYKIFLESLSLIEATEDFTYFHGFDLTQVDLSSYQAWCDSLSKNLKGKISAEWVRSNFLFAVVNNKIVGRVSIRYELNDELFRVGGHIGYAVFPPYRSHGYATEILRLALQDAKNYGLKKVLLTANPENTASRKVIEKNSGILECIKDSKVRYWIDL